MAASRQVPRIVAAMGAHVEAVVEVRHATHAKELEQYDYILVKDPSLLSDYDADLPIVNVQWVKECLITGRLLPIPEELEF